MPTYDYKCDNCGHQFETYQSMKDDKLTICPSCGENTLIRLIGTGSGLIFKGSGFYLTDYKNKPVEKSSAKTSSNNSAKTDTASSPKETAATESKTSTDPAVKQNRKKDSKPKSEK